MAADGSIVVEVKADDKNAQKELNRLAVEIDRLKDKIKLDEGEKGRLEQQLAEISAAYKQAVSIGDETAAKALEKQFDSVQNKIAQITERTAQNNDAIAAATERAGQYAAQLAGVGESGSAAGSQISDAMKQAASRVEKLGNRIIGLAKRVFVFTLITKAFRTLRTYLWDAVKANDEAATAIGNLKGALLTLAQPILSVVVPAFTALANVLTRVISAIASIVSALFGTTAQESAATAESLSDAEDAMEGYGGAAKDAAKQLAGFDEIQKLSGEDAGGGGGNAAKNASAIAPLFDAIKNFELPDWLDEFLESLHITIEDVFFDWSDLTGEQIAEKCLTGLFGLAGGVIGFALGGVPGAIIGTLTGVAIGLVISSLIFDHDGELSEEEILTMICVVAGALAGGVLGFALGGPVGAIVGTLTGAALGIAISKLTLDGDGTLNDEEILKMIVIAAGVLAGGMIGFAVGGPLGAAIGITVGAGLSVLLNKLVFDDDGEVSNHEILSLLCKALYAIVGGVIGFTVGGPLGAAIGAVLGIGLEIMLENVLFKDENGKVSEAGEDVINAFFSGMAKKLLTLPKWIKDNLYTPLIEEILHVFGIDEGESSEAAEIGGDISAGLLSGMSLLSGNTLLNYGWVAAHIFAPLWKLIKSVFGIASPAENMKPLGNYISEGILSGISGRFKNIGAWSREHIFDPIFGGLKKVFGIEGNSASEMENAGEAMGNGIKNGLDNAISGIKGVLNSIIDAVETAINWIISKLNGFGFDVPNLPILGGNAGKHIGFSIDPITIPRLAAGAVIPPNREFLAVLGDQRSGNNIEAPEAALQAMANQAASANAAYLERIIALLQEGKVMMIGSETFARLVYNTNRSEMARHGGTLVNVTGRL